MAWIVIGLYELIRHSLSYANSTQRVEYQTPRSFNEIHQNNTVCSCSLVSSVILPRLYDVWYVTNTTNVKSFTYSAYYDDRADGGPLPFVRILAVAVKIKVQLYCQVWYEDWLNPDIVELQVKANGGGHKIGKYHYEQLFYSCPLHTMDVIPTHVSIVEDKCSHSDNLIPVIKPYHGPPIHEFGICVPIAFENIDPYRIVEWVEANRLLGVSEINVYHVNMHPISLKVLEYYEKEGILKLFHIPSAPYYVHSRDGNKISSPISLNDCVYRNMYRYKWAVIIDIDELIVPTTTVQYSTMIQTIDEHHNQKVNAMAYTFRNTYFWTDCGLSPSINADQRTYIMRLRNREAPSKEMYAAKSFINPQRCLSVFNHYCYIRFPNANKKWTLKVDPSLALSHHYRIKYHSTDCNEALLVEDNSVDSIATRLQEKFNEKVALIKL